MWCWLSLKIIDFIQSFSSILETFLPHLLVHCHPFRFQNETWENRSWTLGTWSAQPAGLLPKAGGEGQPVSGAFPPESHTPVSPQGVATSCQCAWGREEGKGCGPRGESGDLHSSSAPARPCSGPAVPSSEAPWLWFSKESILCQGKGGSAGRAGGSGRRAVIGNKQCAFYYLNPRYQASAMVRAKWPQCWVASFSPLLLVNNHLFFFFFSWRFVEISPLLLSWATVFIVMPLFPPSSSSFFDCHLSRVSGREGDKNAWSIHHLTQESGKVT